MHRRSGRCRRRHAHRWVRPREAHGKHQPAIFGGHLRCVARRTLTCPAITAISEPRHVGFVQAALIELFETLKESDTPVVAERLDADIDQIVCQVH